MKLANFDYYIPPHLIAQMPLKNRSQSRLLVLNKDNGEIADKPFGQIIDYFQPEDTLVLNNTRVIPARLFGISHNGEKIEILIHTPSSESGLWQALIKPAKRVKRDNMEFIFSNELTGKITRDRQGKWQIRFNYQGEFFNILDKIGKIPIPPYIKREVTLEDNERYQTVYASEKGAVAAPTAGLHFTKEMLDAIKQKGVSIVRITLHVGVGTFKPIRVENIEDHQMMPEYYKISQESAQIINQTRGKIIAVGTTTVRALESSARGLSVKEISSSSGWTDIFIYPGYKFKVVDALITNFHLPCSTLLMLVSAFAGKENILTAYQYAIKEQYRFYSYGDAMLIV